MTRKPQNSATPRVRREADARLQRYTDLYDFAPVGYFTLTQDGLLRQVNLTGARLLGIERDRLSKRRFGSFVALGSRPVFNALIEKVLIKGDKETAEVRLKKGKAAPLWLGLEVTASENRQEIYMVAVDITERKQAQMEIERLKKLAEQKLRRNEAVLKLFVEHSPAAIAMLDHEMKYIVASHRYLEDYDLGKRDIVGQSHYEVFPDIPECWKESHRRCLAGAIESMEEDPFPRLSGQRDWIRWELRPWHDVNGEIGGLILFSEVITERKRAEAELQKRFRELNTIYESAQHLQKLTTPEELSTEIIWTLEKISGYEYGAVLLVDGATGRLIPFAISAQGGDPAFAEQDKAYILSHAPRVGRGITGWVAEHGESALVNEVTHDSRYYGLRENIRSELCVPLWINEKVFGVINIESAKPGAYTLDDQRVLETIAAQFATAIQNTRLLESVREQAGHLRALSMRLADVGEAERRELARELHDRVGQSLTVLNLNLTLIRNQLPPESAQKLNLRLDDSLALVAETMGHVRNVMTELRPPALDDYGLTAALRLYAEQVSQRTGLRVSINGADLAPRLSPAAEIALFRVAQEALTNTLKHAHATHVAITLSETEGRICLSLADNGVGFDPAALTPASEHWGLLSIRERALAVGGQVRLEAAPGQGVRLSVEIERRPRP